MYLSVEFVPRSVWAENDVDASARVEICIESSSTCKTIATARENHSITRVVVGWPIAIGLCPTFVDSLALEIWCKASFIQGEQELYGFLSYQPVTKKLQLK